MTHRFPTGVQSLCTGDVCHVPIAEGVSTFYILFQPKCNRRFIFTWSVIYFTVFYANSMTYYLKNLGSASSQGSKVHYGELPRQASAVIYLCLTATCIFLLYDCNIYLAKKSDYDSKWVNKNLKCQLQVFILQQFSYFFAFFDFVSCH